MNIPAVIIESDYFSLSVLGDKYTEKSEWELALDATTSDLILTTMVIKDLAINASDSTYLFLVDEQGDTMFNAGLFSDLIFTSQDSISVVGIPSMEEEGKSKSYALPGAIERMVSRSQPQNRPLPGRQSESGLPDQTLI